MGSLPGRRPTNTNFRIYACFCRRGSPLSTQLESYDPSNHTWRRIGPIPGIPETSVLKGFALISLGDCVYVIGGRLCQRSEPGRDGDADVDPVEVDVAVRTEVLRYNIRTEEWSSCAQLIAPRFDFACAACDGKIYAAGGQCMLSAVSGAHRWTATAEVYDPSRDQWAALPDMSTPRYKCVAVTWEGRFHVVGGFTPERECLAGLLERSSAEAYDEGRSKWDLIPGMWQLDVPPNQIAAVGGRLLSSGDCLNTWKGQVEAYDGKLKIWNIVERSQRPDLSSLLITHDAACDDQEGPSRPSRRLNYLTLAPVGTRLYFLAGYQRSSAGCSYIWAVHTFDTEPDDQTGEPWTSFEPTEEDVDKELCSHCCVAQL
ncbi:kelch-like protein 21 [Ananas comosus]|uniref:F-box/kelch-repeat protein n=2 Tax=Ananas comosus TaxID=4615 RepID=A0A199VNS9_ANACO|nr:kelch-like protein 21 [Ananas comosus]OAY78571.1 F-box/kelch-repeat protein [Ananas comosus]CAD1834628.1 unnamed protein product [Ananas comosus var. bracteatus]